MDIMTKMGSDSKLDQGRAKAHARHSPTKRSHQIKVDINCPDGSSIKHDVDIKALRRFSNAAKPKIPIVNTAENPEDRKVTYTFVPVGHRVPIIGAITGLLSWMENRKHDDRPDLLRAEHIQLTKAKEEKKLELLINILASCYAFKAPFSTELLVQDVEKMMHKQPLTKTELQAVWELLPTGHLLNREAVGTLTRFYQRGEIEKGGNARIEEYVMAEPMAPKLKRLFEKEVRDLASRKESVEVSRG